MLSEAVQVALFQFLSAVVQASAWPVAAVVALLVLKKPISRLIDRFRALGFGEWKLSFEDKLERAEALTAIVQTGDPTPAAGPGAPAEQAGAEQEPRAKAEDLDPTGEAKPAGGPEMEYRLLSTSSPYISIVGAWLELQEPLRRLAKTWGAPDAHPEVLLLVLANKMLVSKTTLSLYGELKALRDAATDNPNLTVSDAVRFHNLTGTLVTQLERAISFLEATPNARAQAF